MTLVAGHQPNLYPYGGFFSKAASADKFVIVDNTQYVKKQYHNRNRVKLGCGDVLWLSVPVKTSSHPFQLINEVETDDAQDWRGKHRKTLERSYGRAPFFHQFYPGFESLLSSEWGRLSDFNIAVIRHCLALLRIETPVLLASEIGAEGKATGLIRDICVKTGSDSYLHGKHSLDYVDFKLLDDAGIKSLIQDFSAVEYKQVAGAFEPNLSILDIIFNCGDKSMDVIMGGTTVRPHVFA